MPCRLLTRHADRARSEQVHYDRLVHMYAHDEVRGWGAQGPSDDVIDAASVLLRMLADPTRMRILWLLGQREYDVATLAEDLQTARPAISQHLAKLKLAGLVQSSKDGRRSVYSLRGLHLHELLTEVFSAADHQANALPDHRYNASMSPGRGRAG
jgi:DNA-binding transcriptional ArsR family regulator